MPPLPLPLPLILVLASGLAAAGAAGAQAIHPASTNDAYVIELPDGSSPPSCNVAGLPAGAAAHLVCGLDAGTVVVAADASNASGVLRAGVNATNQDNRFRRTDGYATARWYDELVFTAGPLPATVRFGIALSGTLGATVVGRDGQAVGQADYLAVASASGQPGGRERDGVLQARLAQTGSGNRSQFFAEQGFFDFPTALLLPGETLLLREELTVRLGQSCLPLHPGEGCAVEALGNFNHTAGLSSLQFLDAAGQDIGTQVSAHWAHGLQTLSAVPEPATPALWALAALVLAARRGRRAARLRLAPAGLALLLAAGTAPAGATARLAGNVNLGSPLLGLSYSRDDASTGPALADSITLGAGAGAAATGHAGASYAATFGQLRVATDLGVALPGALTSPVSIDSGAGAQVALFDAMTINAPGLTGSTGSVQVRLWIHGFNGAGAEGSDGVFNSFADAGWALQLALGSGAGSTQLRAGGCSTGLQAQPLCNAVGDPMGWWTTAPISFRYGETLALSLTLQSGVFGRTVGPGWVSAASDLSHTVVWGGLTALRDASGQAVSDFSVSAESGTDWAHAAAVPEPGTAALVLAGGLLLALLGGKPVPRRTAALGIGPVVRQRSRA